MPRFPTPHSINAMARSLIYSKTGTDIAGNSVWLMLDKILRMLVGITIGALVARHLGPNEYGILSYAIALSSMLVPLVGMGMDGILLRELSVASAEKQRRFVGTSMVLKMASGLAAFSMLVAVTMFTESRDVLLISVLVGLSLMLQFPDIMDTWFQSGGKTKYITVARGAALAIASIAKLWMIANDASLTAFAVVFSAELALAGLALIYLGTKTNRRIKWEFRPDLASDILSKGWPLCISGLFVILIMQSDRIMIKHLLGNEALGMYSAAAQISGVWYMIPVIIGAATAPHLSKLANTDQVRYRMILHNIYTTMTIISALAGIFLSLISNELVRVMYGDVFSDASQILTIHIWGAVFIFHVSIRTRAYIAEHRQTLILKISALTLLSNVALNLVMIPKFGTSGAAYAFIASWGLCALVFPAFWDAGRGSVLHFLTPSFRRH